jgi:hypothetical protein
MAMAVHGRARLFEPGGVVSGADGNIADTGNGLIRRVTQRIITTVAGTEPQARSAAMAIPRHRSANSPGMSPWSDGSLYIADTYHLRIRRVGPDGIITTFAGNGLQGTRRRRSCDGGATQPACDRRRCRWHLYIADEQNNRIRRVGTDGIITVAGIGTVGSTGDGDPATQAVWPIRPT